MPSPPSRFRHHFPYTAEALGILTARRIIGSITALGRDKLLGPQLLRPFIGLRDHNTATLARWWEQTTLAFYNPITGRLDPDPHPQVDRDIIITPYNVFAASCFPRLSSLYRQAAHTQASASLFNVLCAIERFHLDHGQRPGALDWDRTGVPHNFDTTLSAPAKFPHGRPPKHPANPPARISL